MATPPCAPTSGWAGPRAALSPAAPLPPPWRWVAWRAEGSASAAQAEPGPLQAEELRLRPAQLPRPPPAAAPGLAPQRGNQPPSDALAAVPRRPSPRPDPPLLAPPLTEVQQLLDGEWGGGEAGKLLHFPRQLAAAAAAAGGPCQGDRGAQGDAGGLHRSRGVGRSLGQSVRRVGRSVGVSGKRLVSQSVGRSVGAVR